jgi:hypothetical protein
MSRDAARLRVFLVSAMPPDFVRRFLLTPAANVEEALGAVLADLPVGARVGIMPRASSTIPFVAQPGAPQ